jgi:hypothetical protein
VPATHPVHSAEELAAIVEENMPAAQLVHTSEVDARATSLYVPRAHSAQVPPAW